MLSLGQAEKDSFWHGCNESQILGPQTIDYLFPCGETLY